MLFCWSRTLGLQSVAGPGGCRRSRSCAQGTVRCRTFSEESQGSQVSKGGSGCVCVGGGRFEHSSGKTQGAECFQSRDLWGQFCLVLGAAQALGFWTCHLGSAVGELQSPEFPDPVWGHCVCGLPLGQRLSVGEAGAIVITTLSGLEPHADHFAPYCVVFFSK